MAKNTDPSELDNYFQQCYKDYWKQINSELSDVSLTKQQAIMQAVKRLTDQVNFTISMIDQLSGNRSSYEPEPNQSEMSFKEFLYWLPRILNVLAMDLYVAQRKLNSAVFLRYADTNHPDTADAESQPVDVS